MARGESRKNTHKVSASPRKHCECQPWELVALHDLLMRSPKYRFKEIVYRLNVEQGIPCGERTLEAYLTPPGARSGQGMSHRCLPAHMIQPLTKASENYILVHAHNRQAGLKTPRPSAATEETAQLILRRALVEIGKNIQQVAGAMPDSPLDSVEEQRIAYSLSRLRDVADSFVVKHERDLSNVTDFPRRRRA